MYIEIDTASIPPVCRVVEADDTTSLSVRIVRHEHSFISPDVLRALAAETGVGADWDERFDAMLRYAGTRGWLGPDGSVRAHLDDG